MDNGHLYNPKSLHARIVSGSVVLLSGSGLTTAINLAYNIVLAQFLGPKGFGHATVVYTLLTVLSALTLSFQIVSTKLVAQQNSLEAMTAIYRGFHRSAVACGLSVAAVLLVFQQPIASYLNLPDARLVALLAIGAAFYVPLGARRGLIQGTYGFRKLAGNLVLEGAVRLGGSFAMIVAGYGVRGVIEANAAAIAVAYLAVVPKSAPRIPSPLLLSHALRETCQALVFYSGQVLISNCDIVLVKHFFSAYTAGVYAAVAMVGRVILAFSSSVVNTTFPLVAGEREEVRKDLSVIATALLLVLGIGSLVAFCLCVAPDAVWTFLFGRGFQAADQYSVSSLLALYALATVMYSLSVVIITFEMSYKIANTSWVQLAFSAIVIAAICRYHSSLHQVILVQLYLMVALFVCVAIPFLIDSMTNPRDLVTVGTGWSLRLARRISEDEVVAEFLKSDFDNPAFRDYQGLRPMVVNPNLGDPGENGKRRALLFLRHFALWREIPSQTEWYEIKLSEMELDQIRVFPRAQWRKLARGSFSIKEVAENLRGNRNTLDPGFSAKLASIGDQLKQGENDLGAVILIGLDEHKPVAILDGNHRFVAALLARPQRLEKLKFICGLSPRMAECCWYNTNFVTLCRYVSNVLAQAIQNPEAKLARLLETTRASDAMEVEL